MSPLMSCWRKENVMIFPVWNPRGDGKESSGGERIEERERKDLSSWREDDDDWIQISCKSHDSDSRADLMQSNGMEALR